MDGLAAHQRLSRLAPMTVLLALLLSTGSTWLLTLDRWTKLDESYSHGFLLLAVSIWLSIQTWQRERPVTGFYPLWLAPLLLGMLGYVVGDLLGIQALRQVVLVPLILAALAVLWGWRQLVPFLIPVGVLFFTIPVWDFISWPLQLITTSVNQVLLGLYGVEFEVEGVFVYLIGIGAFEIAHGCSGLRYLLVGMTLSALYGHLNLRLWSSRIMLFTTGVAFALMANWIRVFIIILAGYLTDMETSLIEDHDAFGWWVFAGTLVPLFFIARAIEGRAAEQESAQPASRPEPKGNDRWATAITALLPIGMVLAFSGGHAQVETRMQTYAFDPLPSETWAPLFQRELEGWQPRFKGTDRSLQKTYFLKDEDLELGSARPTSFVGLYTYNPQRGGHEAVMYGNRLYDRGAWLPEMTFNVDTGDGISWQGLTLRQRASDKHLYLAYSYYVESFWETNEVRAKLAQLLGVFNARSDGSLMVVALHCGDCDGQTKVRELAATVRPRLQEAVDAFNSSKGG
ncbi:EpsI domain-containing exosortase [Halovibrio salipaludis]|uniref:EpsI domain-containing exosortase n=1 Tax=Halovibrio salipaludis TaxID=2032626 RepID=A0A2A2F944_9GAMM|nr:exosortase [Halovibrio salipaludis]PAU81197.1 EpsI domain-containing exosortase [Halovibrio salipaludis]